LKYQYDPGCEVGGGNGISQRGAILGYICALRGQRPGLDGTPYHRVDSINVPPGYADLS
jgi:hypothetical protein